MKTLILIGALLGVCLTQALADDSVNENNQGNDGGNSHQNVNINNQEHIANIHNYNSWNGWDAVWDYSMELFATRLFSKRACIVAKMNKEAFPSLEKLSKFKDQKPAKGTPPPPSLRFSISKTRVRNVAQFGRPIDKLCNGVPTYYAREYQGEALFFETQGCANAGILGLFGIYLCGNISGC
ncbi:gastrokine-1-like [Emydura macquarii macquarii]|uniref:gastrokine-1-like n=1 Tax=Emydura macquarii macquarii TaxID=1129001 RepID=UPI00352BA913